MKNHEADYTEKSFLLLENMVEMLRLQIRYNEQTIEAQKMVIQKLEQKLNPTPTKRIWHGQMTIVKQ